MSYASLESGMLYVFGKFRKLPVEVKMSKKDLIAVLEKADDQDPGFLIDIEEMTYFSPSDPKIVFYAILNGVQFKKEHYMTGLKDEDIASVCEIIYKKKQGLYIYSMLKREKPFVVSLLASRKLREHYLCYNVDELIELSKVDFEAKDFEYRKKRYEEIHSLSCNIDLMEIYVNAYKDVTVMYKEKSDFPFFYDKALYMDPEILAFEANKRFGMIVPADVFDVRSYFTDNIHHYLKSGKTDMYFFEQVNGFYPYRNRQDIEYRFRQMKEGKTGHYFLLPLKYDKVSNTKTTLLTETKELDLKNVISYNNRWYELEELEMAFSQIAAGFSKPEEPKTFFSVREIARLKELLICYYNPRYDKLLKLIEHGSGVLELLSDKEEKLREKYKNNEKFKELLYSLFECGMYMRRWKGPGHKYPEDEKETTVKVEEKEFENFVSKLLLKLNEDFSEFKDLQIKGAGGILLGLKTFGDLFTEVKDGKFCIRVASLYFINTACYYLLNIYGEKVKDYTYKADLIT